MGKKVSTPNMKASLLIQNLKEKGNCGGRIKKCLKESSRMEFQLRRKGKLNDYCKIFICIITFKNNVKI